MPQYLATNAGEKVPVAVKVEKLNPTVTLVYYETKDMSEQQDVTFVRFTLDNDGKVVSMNADQKPLARK